MPDFDKDLNPILLNKDESLPVLPNPATPRPNNYSGFEGSDLAGRQPVDPIFGRGPIISPMAPTVSAKELYDNRRYDVYSSDIVDQEDQSAYAQSGLEKAKNGLLKGVNLAATTIAGGFGMIGGAAQSTFTGRLADIWDNPFMQGLDKWNNEVDQTYLPNYYTNVEKNAKWYSTDNWITTNFLFDKVIKNAGFAVGAMVSGNIINAGLLRAGASLGKAAMAGATAAESSQAFKIFSPLLRNTARAFSNGKNIEAAALLEGELSSIADVAAKSSKLAEIASTTNRIAGFSDTARRTAVAIYSSAGESAFEALQTSNQYRETKIQEYKNLNGGIEPSGEALEQINREAEAVGKTSFFGNMALLSATEYIQLPYLLGSSYKSSKQAANSLIGKVDDVVLEDGKYIAKTSATTKFGKLYQGVKGVGQYVFDPKEAGQEIGQYALQVGAQNYYNKAFKSNDANAWVDGFLYGMVGKNEQGEDVGALVSKEGIESGIIGGLTGGVMQAKGTFLENKAVKANTATFLNQLNTTPSFRAAFEDRMNSINRGVVLQKQQQDAVIAGDELEAKDLKADLMHNYLAPRIKYGRFDMVMDDIQELKRVGATEGGLSELKEQGVANINDTVQSYQQRLTQMENVAKSTEQLYKAIDLRYSGVVNKDGEKVYSPEAIDKMVYSTSKIADYDLRIPQLNAPLAEAGVATTEVLQSIIKDGKPNKEATADALEKINELDVLSDVKNELKTKLSDVIELSLRRKLFMEQYDDIKENPDKYKNPEAAIETEAESNLAKVKQEEEQE